MRSSVVRGLIVGLCVVWFAGAEARAQDAHRDIDAHGQTNDWVTQAESLAHYVESNNLLLTDAARAARLQQVQNMQGETRLQALYDIAVKFYIDGDAEHGVTALAQLESEAHQQNDARFAAMAGMIRAYAPARTGDIVGARREIEAALNGVTDSYVRAAGERLHAYVLTDLGMFGNALEAARAGILHLPDDDSTASLRAGLHNAMTYNASRIGDSPTALTHLQRNVELTQRAGIPVDGLMVLNNVAIMLGQANQTEAAQRVTRIHEVMARRSGVPRMRFLSAQLCARIDLLAGDDASALRCADEGMALIAFASPEYEKRVKLYRLQALAELGRGHEARQALTELRAMASSRSDPGLSEKLDLIEPEVLYAEGHYRDAFQAMRHAQQVAEHNVVTRFNDGVRELRANMESEVAQAEDRAQAQAMRAELQSRTTWGLALAVLLAVVCLCTTLVIAWLIYRSRHNMLKAVGRAEEILARRIGGAAFAPEAGAQAPTERLTNILDEIERRDVELKQAFDALETARAAAEEANAAKSQFLTTMSHELRTPLNAIIGYSEILMEIATETHDENQLADLTRILGAGKRLLLLINDVLDLSKIEAGRMSASAQSIDVAGMLDEIVATVKPVAAANNDTVMLDCAPDIGAATTDSMKLSQCLLNLTSNAVKFTKNGAVRISARREMVDGAAWLKFEIADTGIGISREAQARLFQPFMQADNTITRAHGGTGLGLAITRRLAGLLGGDVSMQSEIGKGSLFTLRVPVTMPIASAGETRKSALSHAA